MIFVFYPVFFHGRANVPCITTSGGDVRLLTIAKCANGTLHCPPHTRTHPSYASCCIASVRVIFTPKWRFLFFFIPNSRPLSCILCGAFKFRFAFGKMSIFSQASCSSGAALTGVAGRNVSDIKIAILYYRSCSEHSILLILLFYNGCRLINTLHLNSPSPSLRVYINLVTAHSDLKIFIYRQQRLRHCVI